MARGDVFYILVDDNSRKMIKFVKIYHFAV